MVVVVVGLVVVVDVVLVVGTGVVDVVVAQGTENVPNTAPTGKVIEVKLKVIILPARTAKVFE